ncbi:MAG TPA: hypothetical protein PLP31_11820 [Thermoanaerobaculaceae bacterium]|nr:hypothetical protein [Acidobacteriota bacterium]HPW56408.1 hypothetical protein [Thermoanaerobaculaceae bacterium]
MSDGTTSTETTKRRKRRDLGPLDLAELVGADVEVRTVGGGAHRGEVVAVGPVWLALDRRTGGRLLARLDAVTAIQVDDFRVRGQ